MLASILIIGFSLVLFVYWFRYCCSLVLRNSQEQLAALPAVADTRFGVADVIERLRTEEELDPIHRALRRDYEVFTYLVQHAAGLELSSIEDRVLLLDYQLMQVWYRMTLAAAPRQAREALSQMASILSVLVRKMGQQAGLYVEA
ncbi:MAG TPA: hypothetical protein VNY05_04315 [Candidatus Acidoferrales bacterium]|jgi:hypothetical protein|nr:hypothetical protein [Candidatus Acidoferrales bacterium]